MFQQAAASGYGSMQPDDYRAQLDAIARSFDARLVRLGDVLVATHHGVIADAVVDAMQRDDTSAQFVGNRINEILEATIDSERETTIKNLTLQVAQLGTSNSRLQARVDELQAAASTVSGEITNTRVESASLREQLINLESALQEEKHQCAQWRVQVDEERGKRERVEQEVAQVRQLLAERSDELEAARAKQMKLAGELRLRERELSDEMRSQILEQEKAALAVSGREQLLRQEKAFLQDKYDALEKAHEEVRVLLQREEDHAKEVEAALIQTRQEARRAGEHGRQVEKQLAQLQRKYVALGAKIESLLQSEDAQVSRALEAERAKRRKIKHKYTELKKSSQEQQAALDNRVHDLEQQLKDAQHAVQKQQDEIRALDAAAAKGKQFEGARREIAQLRSKLESERSAHQEAQRALDALQATAQGAQQACEQLREQVDTQQHDFSERVRKQAHTFRERMEELLARHDQEKKAIHRKYQMLVESRIAALKRKAENHEYHEARLKSAVHANLVQLKKDHVTTEQHNQLLQSERSAVSARLEADKQRALSDLDAKHQEELRQMRHQFEQAEDEHRREVEDVRHELEQRHEEAAAKWQSEVDDAAQAVAQERHAKAQVEVALHKQKQVSAELRSRCSDLNEALAEADKAKQNLGLHLEEASRNIGRAKSMLATERQRVQELETKLADHVEQAKQDAEQAAERLRVAVEETAEARRIVHEREQTIENLEERMADLVERVEHAEAEANEVRAEKQAAVKELSDQLFEQRGEAEKERLEHIQSMGELKRQLAQRDSECTALDHANTRLEEDLQSLRESSAERLKDAESQRQAAVKHYEELMTAMRSECVELRQAAAQAESREAAAQHDADALSERLEQTKAEAADRADAAREEMASLREVLAEREAELHDANVKSTRLSSAHQRMRQQISLFISKQMRTLHSNHHALKTACQTQIHDMQSQVVQALGEVQWKLKDALQKGTEKAQAQATRKLRRAEAQHQMDIERLQRQLREAEEIHREKQHELADEWRAKMERALGDAEARVRRLQETQGSATHNAELVQALRKQLQEATRELSDAKIQLSKEQGTIDDLRGKVAQLAGSDAALEAARDAASAAKADAAEADVRLREAERVARDAEMAVKLAEQQQNQMERQMARLEERATEAESRRREVEEQLAQATASTETEKGELRRLEQELEQRKTDFFNVLMVVARDVPVAAEIQKGLLSDDRQLYDECLRALQHTLQQFVEQQRNARNQAIHEAVANAMTPVRQQLEQTEVDLETTQSRLVVSENLNRKAKAQIKALRNQLAEYQAAVQQQRAQFDAEKQQYEEELARTRQEMETLQNESMLASELSKVEAVAPFKAQLESLRGTLREVEETHQQELKAKEHELERKLKNQRMHMEELLRLSRVSSATPMRLNELSSFSSGSRRRARFEGDDDDDDDDESGGLDGVRARVLADGSLSDDEFVRMLEQSLSSKGRASLEHADRLHRDTQDLVRSSEGDTSSDGGAARATGRRSDERKARRRRS